MSLAKLRELAATVVAEASNPAGAAKNVLAWIRWRGGLMDTYITQGSEKNRDQAAHDGEAQWAYRFPAPGYDSVCTCCGAGSRPRVLVPTGGGGDQLFFFPGHSLPRVKRLWCVARRA